MFKQAIMYVNYPKLVISFFATLSILGLFLAISRINFSFDFEQFFPSGDEDLEYFLEFRERFEPDDNFLLIGIKREEGVFQKEFLEKVLQFSLDIRRTEWVVQEADTIDNSIYTVKENNQGDTSIFYNPVQSAQCLLQFEYPIRNVFTGFSTIPAIHLEDSTLFSRDSMRIMKDERLVGNFISEDAKTLVVVLKTVENIDQESSKELIKNIKQLVNSYQFKEYHILGKVFFQTEIVKIQIWEFILATLVSILLVTLSMFFIFRKLWGVIIALVSILVGLLMFVGYLGLFAVTLDTMALLYPVIMIIVATSDVVHVMSKYIDELLIGKDKVSAIKITIKEIGMSIFLTSTTTAIGFISLVTSKLIPIQQFGLNAAIGVMIAYFSVLIFTTTLLALFPVDKIIKLNNRKSTWVSLMEKVYWITKYHSKKIVLAFLVLITICFMGISMVSTNTQIEKILPKNAKVTNDFLFFEENFSGFRPFEIAVSLKDGFSTDDFEVIQEIDKIEQYFKQFPEVKSMTSITSVYKSIHQAYNSNNYDKYVLPESENKFKKYKKFANKLLAQNGAILVSKDKKYARISARVLDIGADNIKKITEQSTLWMNENIDSSILSTRLTGTGIIIDKNSDYVRDSLFKGLLFAILLISIIIAFIYKNIRMLFIALIPNVLPMLIAAAILGFLNIPLEAGVAIVFAIIFGIAIDDTIHLLSKFKLTKDKGYSTDAAILIMLKETGKAICLTTIILFFGFLSLFLSSNPPAITIGLLISGTLLSALICDVFIIPVMLRKWIR